MKRIPPQARTTTTEMEAAGDSSLRPLTLQKSERRRLDATLAPLAESDRASENYL